jgi:hypothetical protein
LEARSYQWLLQIRLANKIKEASVNTISLGGTIYNYDA